MKDRLFSIYVLTLLMFAPIFGCFLYLTGIDSEHGQYQPIAIALSAIGWCFFGSEYIWGKNTLPRKVKWTFLYLILFGLVYLGVRMLYLHSSYLPFKLITATKKGVTSLSMSFFLRWASLGVVSYVTGILLVKKDRLSLVSRCIPYFTIPLTIVLSAATYLGAATYRADDGTYGFNYQNVSYYHAAFMCYNAYYVFFHKSSSVWERLLMIAAAVCMLSNVAYALSGGGRGAFLLLLLTIVYVIYKKGLTGESKVRSLLMIMIAIGGFLLIADKLEIWDSRGFYRVSHMIEIDSGGRNELRGFARATMEEYHYMGSGLGSVWYTIGYYSHNVIQDIVLELGILGLLVFLLLMYKTYKKLIKYSKIEHRYQFVIMNSFNLLVLLFSGYWISDLVLWLTWGCAISMSSRDLLNES